MKTFGTPSETLSPLERARENEIKVLEFVHRFGHLRTSEIAMCVWPTSEPINAAQMARRTVNRLKERKELLARQNAFGSWSYLIAARGVRRLQDQGMAEAKVNSSADSVEGQNFYHRTLGTCYLSHQCKNTSLVYGEYAITSLRDPIPPDEIEKHTEGKLPDGLVLRKSVRSSTRRPHYNADWIEVENADKSEQRRTQAFQLLKETDRPLNEDRTITLDRLVFVYNQTQKHEGSLLRGLRKFIDVHQGSIPSIDHFVSRILFVRCNVGHTLIWRGYQEVPFVDLYESGFADEYGADS